MRAIAFDLWETLITDTTDIARRQESFRLERIASILREAGHPREAAAVHEAYRHTWTRCHDLYWSRDRDIPNRVQIEHLLEPLLEERSALSENVVAELEHAYAWAAAEHLPDLVPGADELLRALHGRYRLGLVSNTGRTPGWVLREVLGRYGLTERFDVLVFSDEHGACKPLPSIFQELLRGLGAAPAEAVFVGDNAYADVWGAQQAGMRAVLFDPPSRGHAIGPVNETVGPVQPDAIIRSLSELLPLLEEWSA